MRETTDALGAASFLNSQGRLARVLPWPNIRCTRVRTHAIKRGEAIHREATRGLGPGSDWLLEHIQDLEGASTCP